MSIFRSFTLALLCPDLDHPDTWIGHLDHLDHLGLTLTCLTISTAETPSGEAFRGQAFWPPDPVSVTTLFLSVESAVE